MGRIIAVVAALAALSTAAGFALRSAPRAPRAPHVELGAPAPTARRVARARSNERRPPAVETLRYRFEYRVEPEVDGTAAQPVRISGAWDQTPTPDGVLIQLSAVSIDEHEALPSAASLARTFGLRTQGGAIRELGYDRDADEATRRTFASLASAFWLSDARDAGATAWQVVEAELAGDFKAAYTRDGDLITKRIEACLGLRGAHGLDPRAGRALATEGTTRFEIDGLGVARVTVDLTQTMQMDAEGGQIVTRTRATLERIGSDGPAVTARGLRYTGFDGLIDYSGQQEMRDAERVGDADAASLLNELAALERLPRGQKGTQKMRSVLLKKMSALVRLEPAAAARLAAELRARALRGENTSLIAGALASSKSAAGTNALASLIGDEALPPVAQRNAVNTLGLAHQATTESVEALSDQLEGDMGSAAAMALGNQAKRIAEEAPEQAKTAVEQLIEGYQSAQTAEEKAVYLRALGNTGAREALAVLNGAIATNDLTLKPAAIRGLRFIPGDDVDALLKPFVRSGRLFAPAALDAITWRSPTMWQAELQQARVIYAKIEATAPLVDTIDGILARWGS